MKTKKLGITTLFLLAPFVMANSPAPQVQDSPYDDFTATFVSKTPNANDVEGMYEFTYNITNTGTGYINNIRAENDGRSEAYVSLNDKHFDDIVIAPNKTREITFYSRVDFENSEGVSFSAFGFTEFLENPFKDNDFTVRLEDSYTNSSYYAIDAKFNFDVDESGYRFGAIINATYKGEDFSIFSRYLYSKDEINFSYFDESGSEPFDIEQFTINNILIIKTEYHSAIGDFFRVMEIIAIVFIAVVMGSGLLFICIFFPIREVRKRKRLKAQKNA